MPWNAKLSFLAPYNCIHFFPSNQTVLYKQVSQIQNGNNDQTTDLVRHHFMLKMRNIVIRNLSVIQGERTTYRDFNATAANALEMGTTDGIELQLTFHKRTHTIDDLHWGQRRRAIGWCLHDKQIPTFLRDRGEAMRVQVVNSVAMHTDNAAHTKREQNFTLYMSIVHHSYLASAANCQKSFGSGYGSSNGFFRRCRCSRGILRGLRVRDFVHVLTFWTEAPASATWVVSFPSPFPWAVDLLEGCPFSLSALDTRQWGKTYATKHGK